MASIAEFLGPFLFGSVVAKTIGDGLVDSTVLMALSEMGSEQATSTTKTMADAIHFLDYLATHPDATIRYHASDMILNIHSDALYLSEAKARSRACGHFFM